MREHHAAGAHPDAALAAAAGLIGISCAVPANASELLCSASQSRR
jgi:hypothetical protein